LLTDIAFPKEKVCLLDYGAGCGSISLLAKSLGIGRVVYNDIYDQSCRDAELMGERLNLKADHYIQGDIDSVISCLKEHGLTCNLLVSHNCIEHIYDIHSFFQSMARLPQRDMIFWLSTGANPLRRKTRRELSRVARLHEYEKREKLWGHKERDSLQSYRSIRRDIIEKHFPDLLSEEIQTLVDKTRGLRKDDILRAAREYLATGNLPPSPGHPTNTCDPLTGNWAERLMNPFELRKSLLKIGFQAEVKPLYWPVDRKNHLKCIIKAGFNLLMASVSPISLRLSPGYILYGRGP
jgi:SAM-dependent methyltransferase